MSGSIQEMTIDKARNEILRLQLMLSNRTCATCDHHGVPYGDCPWSPDQGMGNPPAPICHKYDNWNYKKPIEAQISNLEEQLKRLEEPFTYDNLCKKMSVANTPSDYYKLIEPLRAISSFRDAALKASECEHLAKPFTYDELLKEMNSNSSESTYQRLSNKFRVLNYKDSVALADDCDKQYRVLKTQREEEERIERERERERQRIAEQEKATVAQRRKFVRVSA